MNFIKRKSISYIISFITVFITTPVYAHEAYVLDKTVFWNGIHAPWNLHALDALKNINNIYITITVVVGILVLLFANFVFRLTNFGWRFHQSLGKFSSLGPMFVRVAIAAAFFFSASSGSFLGPELVLSQMPIATAMRLALYIISAMILFGVYVELAAFVGLLIFSIGFFVFGSYIITYFNYLGEIIVLLLFGMRRWSFDSFLLGKLHSKRLYWERYETTIIRVFYGVALIYAGITVKLLHPDLTTIVATTWNLSQFTYLFPQDPLLITLGAGILEVIIGIFILIGFEMRMTVLITLFYITLSLFYFRELVWPHLMLYGISLNLLVQPEVFTFDHFIFSHHRRAKKWWQRIFEHHTNKTKSIPNS